MAERLCSLPSQTVGPFFHLGLMQNAALGCLVRPETQGERIHLRFRLLDGDGAPIPDGMIELWQADAFGNYNNPPGAFHGFGRLATGDDGVCVFDTIRPGRVLFEGGCQASHINVSVFARGLLSRLCTRVYFEGDTALAKDPILALVPENRRDTLLAKPGANNEWTLDIHLQGEQETVFFDI